MEQEKIEKMARLIHQVNKAYCEAIGDFSQVDWDKAADWQKQPVYGTIDFLLKNPNASVGATHEIWVENKIQEGWTYGEVKDANKRTHPCLMPFQELPLEQRVKDHLFYAIVREMEK